MNGIRETLKTTEQEFWEVSDQAQTDYLDPARQRSSCSLAGLTT